MARLMCRVCQKNYAQYTCPRCNQRYCSLPCYKGHSLQCTESFSRDNVLAEMKNVEISLETKRKMLQALQRMDLDGDNNLVHEGTGRETDLTEQTLQKLMTEGEITLSDLSQDELKAFKKAVATGELCHLIKPWEPWWLKTSAKSMSLGLQGNSLVEEFDAKNDGHSSQQKQQQLQEEDAKEEEEEEESSKVPCPPSRPLPPLSHLSKADPSPLLPVHLVDLLYSYCFVLRLYNGDWSDCYLDAASDLLTTSKVLSQLAQPETVAEVILYCSEAVCSSAFKHAGGKHLSLLLCDDTAGLLRIGRPAVICALADLQRMLEAAIDESKHKREVTKKETKTLDAASRKVFFIMCWANQVGDDVAAMVASLVEGEKERRVESTVSTSSVSAD